MAITTTIEWADSSLNLEMGCDGCELWIPAAGIFLCYAGRMTTKWAGKKGWPERFDLPALFPERLPPALRWPDLTGTPRPGKPWLDRLPRIVFLDDEGDTFTESLPQDWLAPHIPALAASPHQWLVLTKRPHRAAAFVARHGLPPNVWMGTSVTTAAMLPRVAALTRIPARVRFVSTEPLMGPVDLTPYLADLDWVIVGGLSGEGYQDHPMDPAWALAIGEQCAAAGVPLFVKQDSGPTPGRQGRLPDAFWARKEMPARGTPTRLPARPRRAPAAPHGRAAEPP